MWKKVEEMKEFENEKMKRKDGVREHSILPFLTFVCCHLSGYSRMTRRVEE